MAGFPDANADRYAREHYPSTDWGGTVAGAINDSQGAGEQSASERKGSTASPAMAAQSDKVRKSRGVASSILSKRSGLASQASGADTLG